MTRIVTSTYRYKRPPRKRKAVTLEVPAIARAGSKPRINNPEPALLPEATPANEDRKSAIVTVRRRKHVQHAHLLDDLTPEELPRRADLADAMFQDMKRRIAAKDQP